MTRSGRITSWSLALVGGLDVSRGLDRHPLDWATVAVGVAVALLALAREWGE